MDKHETSLIDVEVKFNYTKERKFITNLITSILCILGMFIMPSVFALMANKYISNTTICVLIGDFIYILVLYLVFLKDLNQEFKVFFRDFKNKFKYSFKIYLLGYLGLIICNLFIYFFLKNISANESQVRELLYNNVVPTMISISIVAPLLEELVFRKSIAPLFKHKWLYVLISGLLFGSAHIMTNFTQGIFKLTDLVYILPYGCLGASFALMDYDNKSTFSSILMHSIHNTFTAILLLVTYFGGK